MGSGVPGRIWPEKVVRILSDVPGRVWLQRKAEGGVAAEVCLGGTLTASDDPSNTAMRSKAARRGYKANFWASPLKKSRACTMSAAGSAPTSRSMVKKPA